MNNSQTHPKTRGFIIIPNTDERVKYCINFVFRNSLACIFDCDDQPGLIVDGCIYLHATILSIFYGIGDNILYDLHDP